MRRGLSVVLLFCSCSKIAIDEYEPRTGIITGTVIFQSPVTSPDACTPVPVGGNAIITLFTEDNPPPPVGVGSPINFIVVPGQQLFNQGSQGGGLFAAPFTIPTVSNGRYTIRGFLDADEDFRPTIPLLAQPTAGDIGGAHVDPSTLDILTVEVADNLATPQVTVTLGLPIPAERPAFAITSTPSFAVPFATPQTLVVEAHAINTTDLQMSPECTRFLISYVDEDDNGLPDDQNGDHLPDVYPRVVLRLRGRQPTEPVILVPAIINPLPYLGALEVFPFVPATVLELVIPPVAVERGPAGDKLLASIPPGTYDTIIISGTGQTWQVPNDLAMVQPNDPPDATQAQVVTMREGGALPAGAISGTVRTTADANGDVYLIAFDALDPPPPQGTGRPRGLATVRRDSLVSNGTGREAPFSIRGLPDANYIVVGILDADGDLSPLVEIQGQPSSGDVGGTAGPVAVTGGDTGGVVVELNVPFLYDRPAFIHDRISVPRTGFPTVMETAAHAIEPLGISVESARVPVALAGTDLEGDNLPDLFPRVILSQIASEGDPRTAPDTGVLIPGIVDPLPFLAALSGGTPFIPADALRIILPPIAISGDLRVSPPPAGRYRVNVLSATGQTWSVPNELDLVLGRAGTPDEDPSQSAFVTVEDTPVPAGAITGTVRLVAAAPAGDYQVVVFAFAKDDPPPPRGGGRPRAIAIVSKAEFAAGIAPYALGGLPTGVYQVRAFLDANDDFVPWFDTMNQPNAGDVGGGHLDLNTGALLDVNVNALGAPVANKEVSIIDPLLLPTDRPSFWVPTPLPVLDLSQGPVSVAMDALDETTDIVTTDGVFPVRWVDIDGNGTADDINGDGNPDVFPIVVAELLDPADAENLTLSSEGVRIPGLINPAQFAPLGFPAADPTQLGAVVAASTVTVVFPPQGVRASAPQTPIAPPIGVYRITVINPAGQTWTIPNELQRAAGTPFTETQGGYLTVRN